MSSVFQRSLGLTLLPKNENSNERSLLSYLHEVETIGNNYFGKLHTTYGYGLFRVMTGVGGRPELEIFYSDKKYPSDKDWKILNFVYKPQDHKSQLSLNIPHQPRIDWQIWFSALRDNFNSESWLIVLCGKVLEKNSLVLDLLGYKVKEKELYYNYSIFDNLYDKFMGWEKQEMLETPTFVKINSYIYYFNPDFTYTSDSKIWLKKFNKQWLPQINSEMLNDFWNQIKYPKLGKNKKVKFSLFQLLPLIDISILAISIYVLVSFLRLKN